MLETDKGFVKRWQIAFPLRFAVKFAKLLSQIYQPLIAFSNASLRARIVTNETERNLFYKTAMVITMRSMKPKADV